MSILEVKNITKSFGKTEVLKGVSFSLEQGQVMSILGSSGSGKTTLTNQIAAQFTEQVTIIKHDNYYKAHNDMDYDERSRLNYDHPNAFETDLMIKHLKALKQGESIELDEDLRQKALKSIEKMFSRKKFLLSIKKILIAQDKNPP